MRGCSVYTMLSAMLVRVGVVLVPCQTVIISGQSSCTGR